MNKAKKIEIIILIILFFILFLGIFSFVHYKIEKPNSYNISFPDVDSIVKGSPVRFMGMNVGHVVKLKRKDKYIICKIRVTKKGVTIPNGTRAKVAFNGLGGSKSIELMPPLTNDTEAKGIVADEALRISDLAGVIKDLREMCVTIRNMMEDFDEKQMSETMREFTDPASITEIEEGIDKLVKEKEKKKKTRAVKFFEQFDKLFN